MSRRRVASATDPKLDKFSSVGDGCVFDLLKMNFLSRPSACFKLVDHIHQASDLDAFSSLSLEKQREAKFYLLQKGVVFAPEIIWNSSTVAPSSDADLVS
ncbi:unnamed protein product [Prunus brigantina]